MRKKYVEVLKEYLEKNKLKAIGYSEEEIGKIERLYNVEIKGDFREFMKFAGRCDGSLLDDDPIMLYRETWGVGVYLWLNYWEFKNEDFPVLHGEIDKKPFVFSIEMENYYYYMRTVDEDLKVYCFDENEETIKDLNMTFNEYMLGLVEEYNPKLEQTLKKPSVGNLLIQCNSMEKRVTGLEKLDKYISKNKKGNEELFKLLKQYLEKNKKEFIGYNEEEIKCIEKLYYIEIKKEFKEFLKLAGKNLGGLLGEKQLILYKNWGIRQNIHSQYDIEEYIIPNKKYFLLGVEDEINNYLIETKEEDMKIYCYNRDKKEINETGMTFNEYIVHLIKKYNPELEELKGVSISGDILDI